MRIVLMAAIVLSVAACASIGRPEGGPKDELPPEYVRSNPAPGSKNVDRTTVEVYFNENIKLDDASNKVVVSPAQQQMPQISANGKKLTVNLRDSLIDNITYTIDFSDAIRDLNEGNILDGFVIDFSTGDSIDSLRISGLVLQAENLEPAQGMIVGAYRNLSDTAIRTIKVERISKTNQLGEFTLRNLKNENYRLFAINDVNRDFHWDRSEDVAFYDLPVKPWAEEFIVTDTLRAFDGSDSIAMRPGIKFFPNDILLTWFNENYNPLYMKDHTRDQRNIIRLEFSAETDSLPILTIVNGENEGKILNDYSYINKSVHNDTLEFWITDSAIIMQDSLLIATRYLKTDSLENINWTTDTIRYFYRMSKAQEKEIEKKIEEREKKERKRQIAIAKWQETGDSSLLPDTVPEIEPIEYLEIRAQSGASQDYHRPVAFTFSEPVKNWDKSKIKLEWLEDSVWKSIDTYKVLADSTGKLLQYTLVNPWEFETQYRFSIDSASVTSIYDKWNKEFKHEFKIKSPEDYSTLIFEIPSALYEIQPKYNWDSLSQALFGVQNDSSRIEPESVAQSLVLDSIDIKITDNIDINSLASLLPDTLVEHVGNDSIDTLQTDSAVIATAIYQENVPFITQLVVQLLNNNENVVATAIVTDGKARFDFLAPGTYYARAFMDFNGNGKWDTGSIEEWRQPEDVYYYPKKINLKQNWDMSQTWDIYELPLEVQKPWDIKKNKPKTKEARPNTDEEEEEDGFGTNYFYQPGNAYGNGSANANQRMNR